MILTYASEFFSIGGGFVVNDKTQLDANAFYLDKRVDHVEAVYETKDTHNEAEKMLKKAKNTPITEPTSVNVPSNTRLDQKQIVAALPFYNAQSLMSICEQKNISIAQVVFQNELQWRPAEEITARVLHIWDVMNESIQSGISAQEEYLPGALRVKRRAPNLHQKLMKGLAEYALGSTYGEKSATKTGLSISKDTQSPIRPQRSLPALDWISLYALSVNEGIDLILI